MSREKIKNTINPAIVQMLFPSSDNCFKYSMRCALFFLLVASFIVFTGLFTFYRNWLFDYLPFPYEFTSKKPCRLAKTGKKNFIIYDPDGTMVQFFD